LTHSQRYNLKCVKTTNKSYCLESLNSFARNISITHLGDISAPSGVPFFTHQWLVCWKKIIYPLALGSDMPECQIEVAQTQESGREGSIVSTNKIQSTQSLQCHLWRKVTRKFYCTGVPCFRSGGESSFDQAKNYALLWVLFFV